MVESGSVDKHGIVEELERSRRVFHELVAGASESDLRSRSHGTSWTNEQLLFHMLFGFILVRALIILVRLFDRLPDLGSRAFAGMLNAATVPFHAINYLGACAGARVLNHRHMVRRFDRTLDAIERRLARESDSDLHRGMHFPVRWDPYFTARMTLEDVYRYPVRHFDHHARQLTMTNRA